MLKGILAKRFEVRPERKVSIPRLLRDFLVAFLPYPNNVGLYRSWIRLQAQVDALKKLQAETATELDAFLPSVLDKAFSGNL